MKRNSNIIITVNIYYKINDKYVGQQPFTKMDKYGTTVYGEPVSLPVICVMRHIIMRKYNRLLKSVVVFLMMNTSNTNKDDVTQNDIVRVISSNYRISK